MNRSIATKIKSMASQVKMISKNLIMIRMQQPRSSFPYLFHTIPLTVASENNHGEHCCYSAYMALYLNKPNIVGCNHECLLFCQTWSTQVNNWLQTQSQTQKLEQLTEVPAACPGSPAEDSFLFSLPFPLDGTALDWPLGGIVVRSFSCKFQLLQNFCKF